MRTLITGASKGIGRALAHEFAKHGHAVILTARDEGLLNELALELKTKYAIEADVIPLDLSSNDGVTQLISIIDEKKLNVECLVNNAGFGYLGDFTAMSSHRLQSLMQLNMRSVTELTHHYAKQFAQKHNGYILQVASTAAFQPGPYMATYYASKAYVLSLSQALSYELQNFNVTVSALCPGPTKTNFLHDAKMEDSHLAKGLIGMMTPEQVAAVAYTGLMKGKRIIIPGVINKLLAWSSAISPSFISMKIAAFIHKK